MLKVIYILWNNKYRITLSKLPLCHSTENHKFSENTNLLEQFQTFSFSTFFFFRSVSLSDDDDEDEERESFDLERDLERERDLDGFLFFELDPDER